MSAWDVAGACGAIGIIALSVASVITGDPKDQTANAVFGVLATIWLAFCVARLFGARI